MKVINTHKRKLIILTSILVLFGSLMIFAGPENYTFKDTPSPIWRGITPGKTTQQDVLRTLGQPTNSTTCVIQNGVGLLSFIKYTTSCLFGLLRYEYDDTLLPGVLAATHIITFKSGIVWTIQEDMNAYPLEQQINVEQFVKTHGVPEKVTWSGISSSMSAILYCDQGVIAHADLQTINKIMYFPPMSLDSCLDAFDKSVPIQNPFPLPDVEQVPDPWGFTENTAP